MNNKKIKSQVKKSQPKKPENIKVDQKKMLMYLSLILVLTAIVFSNAIQNGFVVWDDLKYIRDNQFIRQLSGENLSKIFTSFYHSNYHPLTTMVYAIEYHFFGYNAPPFHLINLLIHLINVSMVFYFIYIFTDRVEAAIIVSLFFGIHPMHVESVAWVSELKDMLYGFFFIGALINYVLYLKTKSILNYVFTFLLFTLSLFSKSAAVVFPVLLFLFDYYNDRKFTVKTISEKVPFLILSIVFGILAIKSQASDNAIVDITPLYTIVDRVFLVSYAVMFYIVKLFIPVNLSTLHYYPVNSGKMLPPEYYFAPIFLILILLGVVFSKKYRKVLIFGLLFFLISISLVLQILPVGQAIVAERYTYIPYIGLFFIIGKIFCDVVDNKFKNSRNIKPYFIGILGVFTVFFSITTYSRNRVWKDGIVLFTDVIDKNPDIFYSYGVRGEAYVDAKQYNEGIADYLKAIELRPNYIDPYHNVGRAYYYINNYQEAIKYYNKAIELKPSFAEAYSNRAAAYFSLGNLQATIEDCNKAISLKPDYADAYVNRGNAKGMMKDYAGSIEDFNAGIKYNPNLSQAYLNRGLSYEFIGKKEEGCEDFRTASKMGEEAAAGLINKYCK